MRILLCVWIALVLPFLQTPAAEKAPDFAAELAALEEEFSAAEDAYYEPYAKAKSDEERANVRVDPAKEPTKLFAAKFLELARRAKGTETGARSLLWVAGNVRDPASFALRDALDGLLDGYLDSPLLEDLAAQFQYGAGAVGSEGARSVLDKLAQDSPYANVKAAALYAMAAVLHEGDGASNEAVALLRRLEKEHPGSRYATSAANLLFEIENLQVGMAAPDFTAVDEKGEAFKLSDYKGKVVILDFWGFW